MFFLVGLAQEVAEDDLFEFFNKMIARAVDEPVGKWEKSIRSTVIGYFSSKSL